MTMLKEGCKQSRQTMKIRTELHTTRFLPRKPPIKILCGCRCSPQSTIFRKREIDYSRQIITSACCEQPAIEILLMWECGVLGRGQADGTSWKRIPLLNIVKN